MKGTSLATMAWRNLWRNRRRTYITLSAIVFGVFLAVLMMAMQDRNWADMIRLAARLGAGHVTMQHPEYLDTPTLTRTVQGTDSLKRLAADDPHVIRVVERITGFAMLATARENVGAGFIAVSPEQEDDETLSLIEAIVAGEFFGSSTDGGIILGEKLASNLDVELGSKLVYTLTDKEGEIVSALARVSGIVRTGSPSVDAGICLLPIDAVREVVGFAPDEAIQVAAFVDDQRASDAAVAALGAEAPEDVAVLAWHELQPDLAVFIAMKVGGAKVMMLVLAVLVAAGIFNTLFVSVMERLREFGIMLAVGFSPGQLFRLIMLEERLAGGDRPDRRRRGHHRTVSLSRVVGHRHIGHNPGRPDGGRRRRHVDRHAGRHLRRERGAHRRLGARRHPALRGLSRMAGGTGRSGGDHSAGVAASSAPASEAQTPTPVPTARASPARQASRRLHERWQW